VRVRENIEYAAGESRSLVERVMSSCFSCFVRRQAGQNMESDRALLVGLVHATCGELQGLKGSVRNLGCGLNQSRQNRSGEEKNQASWPRRVATNHVPTWFGLPTSVSPATGFVDHGCLFRRPLFPFALPLISETAMAFANLGYVLSTKFSSPLKAGSKGRATSSISAAKIQVLQARRPEI
jgi:hypothetical protein